MIYLWRTMSDHHSFPRVSQMLPIDNPFLSYLGVECVSMGEGAAELALTVQSHHMSRWQVTHGGISMTMMDMDMALANRSRKSTPR